MRRSSPLRTLLKLVVFFRSYLQLQVSVVFLAARIFSFHHHWCNCLITPGWYRVNTNMVYKYTTLGVTVVEVLNVITVLNVIKS